MMVEHGIQKTVLDTVTKLLEWSIGQEPKVTHNKHETMNSSVQMLCMDMAYMKEKGAGSAASTAAASAGFGGSLVNEEAGIFADPFGLERLGEVDKCLRNCHCRE